MFINRPKDSILCPTSAGLMRSRLFSRLRRSLVEMVAFLRAGSPQKRHHFNVREARLRTRLEYLHPKKPTDPNLSHETRNEAHIRLKCLSRLIQRVHFGVKPQNVQTAWRSCSAKPRRLFFVRLVDLSPLANLYLTKLND